jgi:hypothetical protein
MAMEEHMATVEMTTFDMTGGYDPRFDYPLQQRPENPQMRDSVSMWISDNEGRFGFPRFCIEAVAGTWDDRGVEANIAFPDGRVLIGANGYPPKPPKVVDGKVVTLNAGPLTFEVVEPLRRWIMTFDGPAYETTIQAQMRGGSPSGPIRQVRIRVETEMAAPPWTPGEDRARSGDKATDLAFGAVGGHRHEQLFRCRGEFGIEGEPERRFEGTGLRIRRSGVRDVGEFPGHCWQSAVFPSGRAFGLSGFPARSDGTPAYCDAFLFEDGKKTYAKMIEAPWMSHFVPHGGDVSLVVETAEGRRVRIGGQTHDSTYIAKGDPMFGDWLSKVAAADHPAGVALPFHQGGARYVWDGETTYGMIERSYPADKVRF